MFQTPQKRTVSKPKPAPSKKVKGAKRKTKGAKKTKRKSKPETKTWATLPDYNDYQNANIERMFRVGRGETINDN